MTPPDNRKSRICPLPPEPKIVPSSSMQVLTRIRSQINPLFLKKFGSILILIGGLLILAAQAWIIVLVIQFESVWGFDPTLVIHITFPMQVAVIFGAFSGTIVLIGATIAYFKNVKIGTFLAIFWALLANFFLALILLLRTEIPEYVFFIPFWQTFSLGIIGSFICVFGGGIGMASLRQPQTVPIEIVYEGYQLKTAGWAFTLIGAAVILLVQLFLMYWYLGSTIFNPSYLIMSHLLSALHNTGIGIFITLCCGIGLIIAAVITANFNAKLGSILTFIFAIPVWLPFYWSMYAPIYLVLLQGGGAAFATAGGILSLSSALFSYRQPITTEPLISQ
ncbi:MAG: hypothetical protein ACFE9D_07705 [Promethearchaeota archaeon]